MDSIYIQPIIYGCDIVSWGDKTVENLGKICFNEFYLIAETLWICLYLSLARVLCGSNIKQYRNENSA